LPDLPAFPLVDELVEILNKQTWPASISMFYTSQLSIGSPPISPLDDMTIWRYLTPADVKDYPERLQRYNSLVASRDYGVRKSMPKSMQLLEYLTGSGWPDTFPYSSAAVVKAEPCLVLDFTTHQYAFDVDIAVIENISKKGRSK
jgi:hypothetical protein